MDYQIRKAEKRKTRNMPKPTGPTDPNLLALIRELRKNKEYKDLAKALSKPRRSKGSINVAKLNKIARKHDAIAVAGKVLSVGEMTKGVNVYAYSFSKQAAKKIEDAGGKCFPLDMLKASKEKVVVIK
jgi:large subunit ribosomal protein L18e